MEIATWQIVFGYQNWFVQGSALSICGAILANLNRCMGLVFYLALRLARQDIVDESYNQVGGKSRPSLTKHAKNRENLDR